VKIQVAVFLVVAPCSVVVRFQRFGGPCCLHLHFNLKMEAARSSETLVSYHTSSWRWRQNCPPKRWYPTTTLQCVTIQRTSTWTYNYILPMMNFLLFTAVARHNDRWV